jgi:hypothetical protein
MPPDAQGRSQPPEWVEPGIPPKEVFGVTGVVCIPVADQEPDPSYPEANQPQARPLEHLTSPELTAAFENAQTGAPGGEPIITGPGCQTQVAGEIAIRKANGQYP